MSDDTKPANFVNLHFDRQTSAQRQALRFTPSWAEKLSNVKKLNGHEGCVNRLAWSEDGRLLASGSDDRQVLLWSYPDTDKSPLALQTEHAANIFGVQFMPCTNNSQIITGSMDNTVMLHHIDKLPTRTTTGSPTPVAFQSTLYGCHRSRVKGVEVEPNNPHLFWSAAEDGTVRQYDTRLSNNSQKSWESANCLLSVKAVGAGSANRSIELKGISLNKAHVHQLAIAAGDVYVRMYDRRMLSSGSPKDEHVRAEPVLQMAPPHACLINSNKRTGRAHTTCVSFGNRGDKLVATYHCDQVYAFDVSGTGSCATAYGTTPDSSDAELGIASDASDCDTDACVPSTSSIRAASQEAFLKAEGLKTMGNHAFFSKDLPKAVGFYSQALHLNPTSPMLHTNRAAALISRDWVGDAMWALKDCEIALKLEPSLAKAHYRRIQALKALNQMQAAYTAIEAFQARFPTAGEDAARLKEEVYALLEERAQHAKQRQWRLMQKKRARDEAQANAQSRQESDDAETAVLATDEQAEASLMASPERATRQRNNIPSLSPLNIARQRTPPAPSPSHLASEVPCPVPDVGQHLPVVLGATNDLNAVGDHSGDSDFGGEAELPEEGWMCEEIDGGGNHVASQRQWLLDGPNSWRQGVGARRMLHRYVGHANVQTDIKEAIFMGSHDELVAAGSDDGSVFIYNAVTGQVVNILQADEDVANCVQCHPTLPVLATSGIEHTIKLWSPEGPVSPMDAVNCALKIRRNQERIMSGPQVLRSISPRVFQALHDNPQLLSLLQRGLASRQTDADRADEEDETAGDINCRVN
ncbi:hypothetical protein WJX82_004068 [Trebouxia sp. C0006]